MKNALIAILLLLTVSACLPDKVGKKDPEPELAGTYQITSFVKNNIPLIPQPGVSGTVNIVKINDTQISFSFTTNSNGKVSNTSSAMLTITKSGGSVYDLIDNGTRIGSIDGTNFSLNISTGSDNISVSAKK